MSQSNIPAPERSTKPTRLVAGMNQVTDLWTEIDDRFAPIGLAMLARVKHGQHQPH